MPLPAEALVFRSTILSTLSLSYPEPLTSREVGLLAMQGEAEAHIQNVLLHLLAEGLISRVEEPHQFQHFITDKGRWLALVEATDGRVWDSARDLADLLERQGHGGDFDARSSVARDLLCDALGNVDRARAMATERTALARHVLQVLEEARSARAEGGEE